MQLAITIEGMFGLTWPRWKRFVTAIEQMGFPGLFRSDHFTLPDPPDMDSLELMVSLTYLASHSRHMHFGSLVAPFSFRDPVFLARQAMAIDDLSGGRMILGVGAGWMEREHMMFGYNLGDVSTRLDRFEEGLEVITRLIRSDEPITFEGQFYQLREAQVLPRPRRFTPVMVGGKGPKRTLPLVARYADIWNATPLAPDLFQERSALLDELLRAEGRRPTDVKRSVMLSAICWQDQNDLERRMNLLRGSVPFFAAMSPDEVIAWFRTNLAGIMGTPEYVIEQMNAYAAAGVDELIVQWFSMDDIEGLETIAEQVLPHITA